MTTTYPALRGKFGTTEYYAIVMRVSELVGMVQFPSDETGWRNNSIEEQFQRKLDMSRVTRSIAPYFASDSKRFSGSLVVAVSNPDDMKFENMEDVTKDDALPFAYGSATDSLGFVTFNNLKLITLDGQHRTKALQLAMHWSKNPESKPTDIISDDSLGDDQITLILVNSDTTLSRYIFNKINKYAKPTSKAGKLITDDDDAMAVMTRKLVEGGTIPKRLVNIESNSLGKSAIEFTLLSTFHDANKALLSSLPVPSIGKPENMKDEERKLKQAEIAVEWQRLTTGIRQWKNALEDPEKSGDKYRINFRKKSLLGRPIGQLTLVKGYAHACISMGQVVDRDVLVKKLNSINWDMDKDMWKGVLVKPDGKVMYGVRAANLASKLVSHLIGTDLPQTDIDKILDFVHGAKRHRKRLPPQIVLQN